MVTKCRYDCEFYSKYTRTCDYTLLMYESRGCPTDACTKYTPKAGTRSWDHYRQSSGAFTRAGVQRNGLEPPADDPQLSRYVVADCGHEVYDGEYMFEWEGGKTVCPECLEDKVDEMSTVEKAALLGCQSVNVRFPRKTV